MNNGKVYDIHERIYNWVINIIKFTNKIPKTTANLVLVKQLIGAATSVGANDQEANAADSRKDFISKYVISRKESKEAVYWLNVIRDVNDKEFTKESNELKEEGCEIALIISSIIKKTRLHK